MNYGEVSSGDTLDADLEQLVPLLQAATGHYQKLVLIYGNTWQAKTTLLKSVACLREMAYVSLGATLSQELLQASVRDRPFKAQDLVKQAILCETKHGIALDHIEILFNPELKLDPLWLLQLLSRDQLILTAWPGEHNQGRWLYATPSHAEYYTSEKSNILFYSIE